jgi:hypothetical protein
VSKSCRERTEAMIFQHTIEAVLNGTKTQTRRVVDPGDKAWLQGETHGDVVCVYRNGRLKWALGGEYAVQPGRGKKGLGRIRITSIRKEHVQDIMPEDACAEGIEQDVCFAAYPDTPQARYQAVATIAIERFRALWDSIQPAGRRWEDNPLVWCLTFELVEEEGDE